MNLPLLFAGDFQGKTVRTVERAGELWFVGRDVAEALGYKKPRNALAAHVDEDEKATVRLACDALIQGVTSDVGVTKRDPTSRARKAQDLIVVSELGVYGLILGSELPEARPFKKWVKTLIRRYRTGDIALADEVLQRNTSTKDAEWLALRAQAKAGRVGLADVLSRWHTPENRLIENVSKLVSRAVLGMTTKEFREALGLKKSQPVRDRYTFDQLSDTRWLEGKLAQLLLRSDVTDHKAAYTLCKIMVEGVYGLLEG